MISLFLFIGLKGQRLSEITKIKMRREACHPELLRYFGDFTKLKGLLLR